MSSTTPVSLLPGTLPYACYPPSPQTLSNDIITLARAFLSETFPGVYVGPTEPPANQRNRVWFNTISTQWYEYINGGWMRQYRPLNDSLEERLWKGSEAELATYDGGDAGAVGDLSGPLWQIDHEIDGRALVGPGTIPGTTPPITIAQGATVDSDGITGTYKHILTELEGAVGVHVHAYGITNPSSDDAFFNRTGVTPVTGYSGFYITGSASTLVTPQTTADLFTSATNAGAGVVSAAHLNMQPYVARYVIKRTARIWITAPN